MHLLTYPEHKCCQKFEESRALICEICNEAYCAECFDEHKKKDWAKEHTFVKAKDLRKSIEDKLRESIARCESRGKTSVKPLEFKDNFPNLNLNKRINDILATASNISNSYKFISHFMEEGKKIEDRSVVKMMKIRNVLENFASYFDLIDIITTLGDKHSEASNLTIERQNELNIAKLMLDKTRQLLDKQKNLLNTTRGDINVCIGESNKSVDAIKKGLEKLKEGSKNLISKYNKEIEELNEKIKEKEGELKELGKKFEEERTESQKTLNKLKENTKKADDNLKRLDEKNKQLKTDNTSIKSAIEEDKVKHENIKEKVEKLNVKYDKFCIENTKNEIINKFLKEEQIKLNTDIENAKKEYKRVKDNVEEIKAEEKELKPTKEMIDLMRSYAVKCLLAKDKIPNIETLVGQFEKKKSKTQEELEKIKNKWKDFCDESKTKQDQLTEEIRNLKTKLGNLNNVIKTKEEQERLLNDSIKECKDEEKKAKGKLEMTKKNVEEKEAKDRELETKLEKSRKEERLLNKNKELLEKSVNSLKLEKEKLENDVDELKKQLKENEMKDLKSTLRHDLQVLKDDIKKHQDKLSSLKDKIANSSGEESKKNKNARGENIVNTKEEQKKTFMWICNDKGDSGFPSSKGREFRIGNYYINSYNLWLDLLKYMEWTKIVSLGFFKFDPPKDIYLGNFVKANQSLQTLNLFGSAINLAFIKNLLKGIETSNVKCLLLDNTTINERTYVEELVKGISNTKLEHFSAANLILQGFLESYYLYDEKEKTIKWINVYCLKDKNTNFSNEYLKNIAEAYKVNYIYLSVRANYRNQKDEKYEIGRYDHVCAE